MTTKKAEKVDEIVSQEKEEEKRRNELLKELKYEKTDESYSFEFGKKRFEFKGYPTMTQNAQIRVLLNTIAPRSTTNQNAFDAIYGSGDEVLMGTAKALTHLNTLLISPENFDVTEFFKRNDGTEDEVKLASFGILVFAAEKDFLDSKKKQS